MEIYKIIKHPVMTEKAVRLMESQNKLMFIVDRKAKKFEIKESIEKMFNIKISKVNTTILRNGKKKAYISLKEGVAMDIATQLGLM